MSMLLDKVLARQWVALHYNQKVQLEPMYVRQLNDIHPTRGILSVRLVNTDLFSNLEVDFYFFFNKRYFHTIQMSAISYETTKL